MTNRNFYACAYACIYAFFIFSCSSEEVTPLTADFTAEVTGEAPNAEVVIENQSTGATSYEWIINEGAQIASSLQETPEILEIDKAGTFEVTLIAKNGSSEETVTKNISIPGHSAILSFENVEFGLNGGDTEYGRLFSFETGNIIKDSEVNDNNGSTINLAFGSMGNTMYYFDSPTVEEYNVPGAQATKINNYESTPQITAAEFDDITDDRDISNLTVTHTEESFGNSSIPHTVLFEIADGRKGVIRTEEVNNERLLVDIKIQKY